MASDKSLDIFSLVNAYVDTNRTTLAAVFDDADRNHDRGLDHNEIKVLLQKVLPNGRKLTERELRHFEAGSSSTRKSKGGSTRQKNTHAKR